MRCICSYNEVTSFSRAHSIIEYEMSRMHAWGTEDGAVYEH